MKLIKAKVENFGSYERLDFDFTEAGNLHLISGQTGSGKSTLCDIVPWTLFGRTAKNGLAGDIIPWNANQDTMAVVEFEVNSKQYTVLRKRGKFNDLSFLRGTELVRGKDIPDTQKLLVQELGITAEQYLISAYYHELSNSAQFFSTTAKTRREMTEQLVDLSEVVKAGKQAVIQKKEQNQLLSKLEYELATSEARLVAAEENKVKENQKYRRWEDNQKALLYEATADRDSFKEDKAKELFSIETEIIHKLESKQLAQDNISVLQTEFESLPHAETCDKCGSKLNSSKIQRLSKEIIARSNDLIKLETRLNLLLESKRKTETSTNGLQNKIDQILQQENPHYDTLVATIAQHKNQVKKHDALITQVQLAKVDLHMIDVVIEKLNQVRQLLIESTMLQVEAETNQLLEDHFDSILRVEFVSEEFDKLDLRITKDGNECSYTQLSKGQRQLLKLCFAVSCMKVASIRSNIKFEQLFMDEILEGLDDSLKIKSFSLLEGLASNYTGVYVVEHNNDLKNLFISKYEVTLINDYSKIEKVV